MNSDNRLAEKILVVEDDEGLSYLIKKLLKRAGYDPDVCASGDRVIEHLKNGHYSLMLLDYQLPDMSARQVIGMMQKEKCDMPFIVMTGHGDERIAVEMMKLGARDYVVKDTNFLELVVTIVNHTVDEINTERELDRAQNALIESEEKYRTLIQNANEGIAVMQGNQFKLVNNKLVEITGFSEDELMGLQIEEIIHPADIETTLNNYYLRLSDKEAPSLQEFRIMYPDDDIRWVQVHSVKIVWDGKPATLDFISDITAKKKAESALIVSENRFRQIFEKTSDAIAVIQNEALRLVNPRFSSLFSDFNKLPDNEVFLDELTQINRDFIRSLIRQSENSQQFPLKAKNQSNTSADFNVSISEIMWNNEPALLAIIRDVSEQLALEAQLLQAQKMESIGRLAGGVAHDFNNLLTVINGYSEIAMMSLTESNPVYNDLVQINTTIQRAANLTKQLLAFSRRQVLQSRVVELNGIISNMQNMLRRIVSEKIEMEAVFVPELCKVKADPSQIEQVIINLVVNASDALPQGGKIRLNTFHSEKVTDGIGTGSVGFSVTDNGIGIAPEIMEHIFEPFFTTKEASGTGLGLSTVYGIVKQSGGDIIVDSEIGKGTTFTILFPETAEAETEYVSTETSTHTLNGTEMILVVEDEQAVREVAVVTLEKMGYKVLYSDNGKSALDLCHEYGGKIDLIISDVIMPVMDGVTFRENIRERWPDCKFIFMSGYPEDTVTQYDSLQNTPFIQKPFKSHDLLKLIRTVLDS